MVSFQLGWVSSAQGTQSTLPTVVGKGWHTALCLFKEHLYWGPDLWFWSLLVIKLLSSPTWQRTLLWLRKHWPLLLQLPPRVSWLSSSDLLQPFFPASSAPYFFLMLPVKILPDSLLSGPENHLASFWQLLLFPRYLFALLFFSHPPEGMVYSTLNVSLPLLHYDVQPSVVEYTVGTQYTNSFQA